MAGAMKTGDPRREWLKSAIYARARVAPGKTRS
jgi:hypothetical protein